MGKRIELNPGWLVSLLTQWVRSEITREAHALGYPRKSPGFSEKTTGGYNHSDPTAFQAQDFGDLLACLATLNEEKKTQWIAIMMHYKPWTAAQYEAAGHPFGNTTYYDRLHAGHARLAHMMDGIKAHRERHLMSA